MRLSLEEQQALVNYRRQKACETWQETKEIIESKLWYAAANRMYYACYYMTTAVLISYGFYPSTHTGVIRLFGMHFVQKGLVSQTLGKFYTQLFELRQRGDYDDWIVLSEEDILPRVDIVEEYMETLDKLIKR